MIRNVILAIFTFFLWMESNARDQQREREKQESIKEFQRSNSGL